MYAQTLQLTWGAQPLSKGGGNQSSAFVLEQDNLCTFQQYPMHLGPGHSWLWIVNPASELAIRQAYKRNSPWRILNPLKLSPEVV